MGIEGLRALAAGSILVYHVWLHAAPSWDEGQLTLGPLTRWVFPHLGLGVTLFFALSGFLLYRPFAAAVVRGDPQPSVKRYLRNRGLRIIPAYWVIFLITALVLQTAFVRTSSNAFPDTGSITDPAQLLQNLFLLQNYDREAVLTGIGPTWSLAIEVVFYVSLPALVALAVLLARRATGRRGRVLAALAPAMLLLMIGLSGKAVAAFLVAPAPGEHLYEGTWHSVVERSFWAQADLFAFGMVIAVVRAQVEDGTLTLPRWWRGGALVALIAVAVPTTTFMTNLTEATGGDVSHYAYQTLMAISCGLLLALVALSVAGRAHRSRLARALDARPLVAVGIVSYSLFLWHEPLLLALREQGVTLDGQAGFVFNLAVVGLIAGVASALTYRFVEAPALRLKQRPAKGRAPTISRKEVEAAP